MCGSGTIHYCNSVVLYAKGDTDDGWVSPFDGKALTGWKANERPDNWTVKDQNIVVRVNGKVVVDYTEPEGANGPRRLSQGYLALQAHDPGSTVKFRNINLRTL